MAMFNLLLLASNCYNIIPGIDKLVSGYDITKFDINVVDGQWEGSRYPLLSISCDKNYQFTNRITNKTYTVPDQIPGPESIKLNGGILSNYSSYSIRTYNELTSHFGINIGLDLFFSMMSASASFNFNYKLVLEQKMFASNAQSLLSAYTMQLVPLYNLKLSYLAQIYFDKMESDYPEFNLFTYDYYMKGIDYFGTHGANSFIGGAIYSQSVSTYSLALSSLSQADIAINLEFNLLNLIDISGGGSGTIRTVSKVFTSLSKIVLNCLGGSGDCPSSATERKQWIIDSFNNPWPVKLQFFEVSELLPAKIKASYKNAVINYLVQSYLINVMKPFYQIAAKVNITISPCAIGPVYLRFKKDIETGLLTVENYLNWKIFNLVEITLFAVQFNKQAVIITDYLRFINHNCDKCDWKIMQIGNCNTTYSTTLLTY